MSEAESIGYEVLTLTHGRWCDDWDAVIHSDLVDAIIELAVASSALGSENVRLVRLVDATEEMRAVAAERKAAG